MDTKDTPLTANWIRTWGPFLITLGGLIFTYALWTARVNALENDMAAVKIKQEQYDANYNALNLDVSKRLERIETLLTERLPKK
jgi:hypothetical protein